MLWKFYFVLVLSVVSHLFSYNQMWLGIDICERAANVTVKGTCALETDESY